MKNLSFTGIFKRCLILMLLLMLSYSAQSQSWNLVWADEFTNGISADWVFETGGGGWGNNELEYYRRENATIENGQLVITAKNENFGGYAYTSSRMKTQGKKSWKYGKIEARIAMPAFSGVWPAFWMLGDNIGSVGWPSCGEIDIMEHVNAENKNYGTVHWSDNNNNYASYGGNVGVGVTAYHTYTIEWTASSIKWFVDGSQFHEVNIAGGVNGTNEFHNNFFILLNMAIGGNWPGFSVNNGALPAKMYVDYVRVYQQGASSGPVSLYQHCDYGGYSASLNVGSYNLSQLQAVGISNDDISSIKVQNGYQLTMYQNSNFSGNVLVKTVDDNCLVNEGFNDDISSVVVSTVSSAWSTQIEAESFATQAGIQTEACSEGGQNVGWIDANDWMVWNVNIPTTTSYKVEYRVASAGGGGNLQLEKAGGSPVYGTLGLPNTGGWQNWQTVSHNVNLTAGQQQIAIKALAGGWNLNWIKITRTGSARLGSDEEAATDINNEMIVYPNPVKNVLTIDIPNDDHLFSLQIHDMSGRLILNQAFNDAQIKRTLDVSALQPGQYVLKMKTQNGTRISRIIKN